MAKKAEIKESAATEVSAELAELESQVSYWCRRQAESILQVGRTLKAIRDGEHYRGSGYVSFADYMDGRAFDGLQIKSTQAYKYISVYERYGDRLYSIGTSNLEVLYILRDLPAEDTDRLIESGEIDTMTKSEAEKLKKELAEAQEQISLLTDEKEKDAEALRAEQETCTETMERLAASDERITELERQLKEAESRTVETVIEPDTKTMKKIKADAKKEAEKKAKAAIDEAAAKAEAAVDELNKLKAVQEDFISEKAAADERIKDLERKLQSAEKPADEQLIEFKFYFGETQSYLKKFVGVINKVADKDQRDKFRRAAIAFVSAILKDLEDGSDG